MNDRSKDRKILLGILGKPFGLKGFTFLKYYGSQPENIKNFHELFLSDDISMQIEEIIKHKGKLAVKFKEINDRNKADELKNREIYVFENQMPGLEEGDYYWYQLEGLTVKNEQGFNLGKIERLMETGANDVMVIVPTQESIDKLNRLIPYTTQVIQEIDLLGKKILVDWSEEY